MRNVFSSILVFAVLTQSVSPVWGGQTLQASLSAQQPETNEEAYLTKLRLIQQKNEELLLMNSIQEFAPPQAASLTTANTHPPAITLTQAALIAAIRVEADYTVATQYMDALSPAYGAFNNVYGDPTWIVPRENALAILGLVEAASKTGDSSYLDQAQLAADYLIRVQDADGGWFDQYSYADPTALSKSPTQTAEVMMALAKLGYDPDRAAAMKKGAEFLMSLQDTANKTGLDDGLICGGKDADGNYQTWRWASDNSFAYQALLSAAVWALAEGDTTFSQTAIDSALAILDGIDNYLYNSDPLDDDYGVWKRAIDGTGAEMEPDFHEWINYAPQMLDLPALGVGAQRVGEWIHEKFQQEDGSVVWNDTWHTTRKSPGFSFQAAMVWYDLGQTAYANAAVNWALDSGLLQSAPDVNGISGGWIDWVEPSDQAPFWQRFIDTSFYAISAFKFGYDFSRSVTPVDVLLARLQGSAQMREDFALLFGVSIPAAGNLTGGQRGRLYDVAYDPAFDVDVFTPVLTRTAALARALRSDTSLLSDYRLIFDAGISASGVIGKSDLQTLFAVAGDPNFDLPTFVGALRQAASLLRSLRASASLRSDFNYLYTSTVAVSGVISVEDRVRLFGVVGAPRYVRSSYLPVMSRAASLLRTLRSSNSRVDFNYLYWTQIPTKGALSVRDLTMLFGVVGTPGYVKSKYLPVLAKTADLLRAIRANSTRLADFNLLYGTNLGLGASSRQVSELSKLFGIAGGKGFNLTKFLPVMHKTAGLARALFASASKRAAFNAKYKTSLAPGHDISGRDLAKMFGITGTTGYAQAKFLASLK